MKAHTLLMIAGLVIGLLAGSFIIATRPLMGLLLAIGSALGLVFLYFADLRAEKHREELHQQEINAAVSNKLIEAHRADFELAVRGSSGFAFVFILLLVSALLLLTAFSQSNVWLWLAGGLGVIFAVLTGLQAFLVLGHPAITLTKQGFETPIVGAIPWDAVQGISLQAITHRHGRIMFHLLCLHVPSLPDRFATFSAVTRLYYCLQLRRARTAVRVMLRNTNVDPQVVDRVAKELWAAKTGRNFIWSPDASDEVNAAARTIGELAANRNKIIDAENPQQIKSAIDQLSVASTILSKDYARQQKLVGRLTAAALIGLAALVAVNHFLK